MKNSSVFPPTRVDGQILSTRCLEAHPFRFAVCSCKTKQHSQHSLHGRIWNTEANIAISTNRNPLGTWLLLIRGYCWFLGLLGEWNFPGRCRTSAVASNGALRNWVISIRLSSLVSLIRTLIFPKFALLRVVRVGFTNLEQVTKKTAVQILNLIHPREKFERIQTFTKMAE